VEFEDGPQAEKYLHYCVI